MTNDKYTRGVVNNGSTYFFDCQKYFGENYGAVKEIDVRNDTYNIKDAFNIIKEDFIPYTDLSIVHVLPKPDLVSIYRHPELPIFVMLSEQEILDIDEESVTTYETLVIFYEPSETCSKFLLEFCNKVKKENKKETFASIGILTQGQGLFINRISFPVNKEVVIETHYNDDFIPEYEKVINLIQNNESGLVLWHGKSGTGKTTMIRHIMTKKYSDRSFIFVPSGLAHLLSEPTFNTLLLQPQNRNAILIIEDAETLLEGSTRRSPGVSNLLNITDGLMKDILGCLVICTFNTELRNIDSALLRPGRLRSKYEFAELSETKVKSINPDIKGTATLAQIYCDTVHTEVIPVMGFKK